MMLYNTTTNLNRGSEETDDYFNDRYCTWDGFLGVIILFHVNLAKQTRCEDLGYDWYEGTAIDVMNQDPSELGIPLDLSASYPVERKGDGKPVGKYGGCLYLSKY